MIKQKIGMIDHVKILVGSKPAIFRASSWSGRSYGRKPSEKLLNTCQLLSNRQRNLVRPHLRSDVISFFKVHHPPTLSNEIFPKWRLKVRENLFHLQYNPVVSRLETQDLATIMKPHVQLVLVLWIPYTGNSLNGPTLAPHNLLSTSLEQFFTVQPPA